MNDKLYESRAHEGVRAAVWTPMEPLPEWFPEERWHTHSHNGQVFLHLHVGKDPVQPEEDDGWRECMPGSIVVLFADGFVIPMGPKTFSEIFKEMP